MDITSKWHYLTVYGLFRDGRFRINELVAPQAKLALALALALARGWLINHLNDGSFDGFGARALPPSRHCCVAILSWLYHTNTTETPIAGTSITYILFLCRNRF